MEKNWNRSILAFSIFLYTFSCFPFPSWANTIDFSINQDISSESVNSVNINEKNYDTYRNSMGKVKVRQIDPSDPDVMDILMKRQRRNKFQPGIKRELQPVQIIPNETPCTQLTFLEFFQECQTSNLSAVDIMGKTTVKYHDDEEFYYYDPEDVCIEVDSNQVVDVYKYDCSTRGVCTCGFHMSSVDPNVLSRTLENGLKEYHLVNGLNRKLTVESGICVSGVEGHCSLYNSTVKEKLTCHSKLDCVLDESFGQVLKNRQTREIYGVCLPSQDKTIVIYGEVGGGGSILGRDFLRMMTLRFSITMLLLLSSFPNFQIY